jgi:hypothetical protein
LRLLFLLELLLTLLGRVLFLGLDQASAGGESERQDLLVPARWPAWRRPGGQTQVLEDSARAALVVDAPDETHRSCCSALRGLWNMDATLTVDGS